MKDLCHMAARYGYGIISADEINDIKQNNITTTMNISWLIKNYSGEVSPHLM